MNLFRIWKQNSYVLAYNNQGKAGAVEEVLAGQKFVPIKGPTKPEGFSRWNTKTTGKGKDYFSGIKNRTPLSKHVLYSQFNKIWVLKSRRNNDKIEFTKYKDGSCYAEVTIPRDKKVFKYYITDDVRKFIDNPRSPKYGADKRTLEIYDNAKRHFNKVYKNGEVFPPISVGSDEYYALILHNMKNGELQYEVVDDTIETQYAVAAFFRILNIAFSSKKPVSSKNQGTGGAKSGWYNKDGSIDYPPNNGAVPGTEKVVTLKPGKILGRYGNIGDKSNFVTKPGVSADKLSLPPTTSADIYQEFVVIKPITKTTQAKIAPWGGSSGGGIQYELPMPIKQLIKDGYIVPK